MEKRKKVVILTLCLIVLLVSNVFAQGGKAEGKVIKFQKGSFSTTVKDFIKGSEESEYTFNAKKGQQVLIAITSKPLNNIALVAKDPDFQDVKIDFDGKNKYSFKLEQSGEFFLSFQTVNKNTRQTNYSFTIIIK